jgi:hypothetical protein
MQFWQRLQLYSRRKYTDLEFPNSIIYGRDMVEKGAVDLILIGDRYIGAGVQMSCDISYGRITTGLITSYC